MKFNYKSRILLKSLKIMIAFLFPTDCCKYNVEKMNKSELKRGRHDSGTKSKKQKKMSHFHVPSRHTYNYLLQT